MSSNVKKNSIHAWFLASRPKTLSAALVPVAIANVLACVTQCRPRHHFSVPVLVATLLFAVVMQIMANFINDYVDFCNGADDETRIGPERACAMGWISPAAMRVGIAVSLLLSALAGLWAVFAYFEAFGQMPWPVFGIGALCMVFAFLYSTYCSYHALGDLLVLVFFGFVPVVGTYYLHNAAWSAPGLWSIALGCGAAMCTLLTVNNIRDRHQDRAHHKMTLVVLCGERLGFWLYQFYGFVAALCQFGFLRLYVGEGVALAAAIITYVLNGSAFGAIKRICEGAKLNKMLAVTSMINLYYGISTILCLWLFN